MRPATLAALPAHGHADQALAPRPRRPSARSTPRASRAARTASARALAGQAVAADSPLAAYASTLRDAEARVHALVGTISARLDADELDRAVADPRVLRVEARRRRRADRLRPRRRRRAGSVRVVADPASATWGLDRIDLRDGLDGKYDYGGALGAGSVVYVLDTGVRTSHDDFEGRAEPGWSARCNDVARNCTEWAEAGDITAENFAASKANDCAFSGHGTHVASTVAGKEYGVAKGATVVAVQVLTAAGRARRRTSSAASSGPSPTRRPAARPRPSSRCRSRTRTRRRRRTW